MALYELDDLEDYQTRNGKVAETDFAFFLWILTWVAKAKEFFSAIDTAQFLVEKVPLSKDLTAADNNHCFTNEL